MNNWFKRLLFAILLSCGASAWAYCQIGYFKYEQAGTNSKICYYDVYGDVKALNVKAYDICPMSHSFCN